MRISKFLLFINLIIAGLLFYFTIGQNELDISKVDLICILLNHSIFSILFIKHFKKKPLVSFMFWYVYVSGYILPFIYLLYRKEGMLTLIPGYQGEGLFFPIFFKLNIIFFLVSLLISKIKLGPSFVNNVRKIGTQRLFVLLTSLYVISIILTLANSSFYPYYYILFNGQIILYILITFYVFSENKKSLSFSFLIFILIYVLYTIFAGSRSGLFNVVFFTLLISLIHQQDFYIKTRRLITFLFLGAFGMIMYPIATLFRMARDQGVPFREIESIWYKLTTSRAGKDILLDILDMIVARFCMLNYSFLIDNNLFNESLFNKYFTFSAMFKSAINSTFPLNMYPDVITTSTYLRVIHENVNISQLRADWSSYSSILLDYNTLYFGKFSLVITIVFFIMIIKGFNLISRLRGIHPFITITTLSILPTLFIFFGYDYLIKAIVHGLIAALSLIFAVKIFVPKS